MGKHPFIFGAGYGGSGGGGGGASLSVAVSDDSPQVGTSIDIIATPSSGFTPVRYFCEARFGTDLIYIGDNGTGIFSWIVSAFGTISIFVYADDGTTTSAYNIDGSTVISTFNPLNLTGLIAGYDASNVSTITIGTGVSAISNLVTGGQSIVQASGTLQPSYLTAYRNGLNAIKFDGANDFLATASPLLVGSSWYVAIACRPVAEAATRAIFSQYAGGTGRMVMVSNQNVSGITASGKMHPFIPSTGLTDFAFTTSSLIIEFESAAGAMEARLNGVVVATGSAASAIEAVVFRLGSLNGSIYFFSGHFYEMWAYNASQTMTNKDGMVAYLKSKWAII